MLTGADWVVVWWDGVGQDEAGAGGGEGEEDLVARGCK